MKRFLVTITLFIALVGSISAKTTKVGDRQYHIKNSNMDLVCEVISEAEALLLSDTLFNTVGMPLMIENNTKVDSEIASLVKKFGYVMFHDANCIIIHIYNEKTNCIDSVAWY